ncbi:hypothetical protein [Streptomyces sp. NPDC004726]
MAKTTLTPEEIARVAYDAGFKDQAKLTRAVAVALAESGGRITVVNTTGNSPPSRDRGLWQINDHWHKEVSDAEAFNPPAAAKHVYRITKGGTTWREWSAWTNGGASTQMGRATLAAAKVIRSPGSVVIQADWWDPLDIFPDSGGGGGDGPDLGSIGDALMFPMQLVEMAMKTGEWVMNPHNWLRVLEVVAGAGVVILGVKMLADSGVGGPVGAAARGTVGAAKKGKAAAGKARDRIEAAASLHPAGAAAISAKNAKKPTPKPKEPNAASAG